MKTITTTCFIALAAFALVGCDKKADATKPGSAEVTTEAPAFSNEKVNDYIKDYTAFCKEYVANVKDPAKLLELSKKSQELAVQGDAIQSALKPDELAKYKEYTSKLAKEMADAAK